MSVNQKASSVPGRQWPALLAILAVPVLLSGLGTWEIRRGAATTAEYAELAGHRGDHVALPPGAATTVAGTANGTADADLLVARLRQVVAWFTVAAGITAGAAGSAGMLLVSRSAQRGRRSRADLVTVFGRVSRVLPIALGIQVVGAVLALCGAVTFEVSGLWFIPEPGDRTVLLAILVLVWTGVVLWGGVATLRDLRRALQAFVPAPWKVFGVPIVETQAPGLFALLHELARERGTTCPDMVAVGTEAGFFVTALPVLLQGAPDTVPVAARGRTLYLPLAELATLDLEELRTVLAHELAHFSGEDTDYSVRFQPLYAGLGRGAEAMSLRHSNWGSTLVDRLFERAVHPHTALAVYAFERFRHVVAHWSRLREIEADRAAVASGSPAALASSLLRLGLTEALLRAEVDHIAGHPGAAPSDLAAALVARMGPDGTGDPAAHLGDQAPHPTDTHPAAWRRIEAVGVRVDAILLDRAARPVHPADLATVQALFTDWDTLSGGVSAHLWERARHRQEGQRTRLQAAADATAGQTETVLHASLLRPVAGLVLLGSLCVAISVGCVLAALYGGAEDREAWRFLLGIAAIGVVGVGFVTLWSVRLWLGRTLPYLVLSEDGIRSPGFDGTLRWLDIDGIGVSALRSPTACFVLRPEAPLPQRTGLIRRLRMDTKQHAVQFMGMSPQGLTEAAFRSLLLRHAQAAHARDKLELEAPALEPASGEGPQVRSPLDPLLAPLDSRTS